MLTSPNLRIVPYEACYWDSLARWYYDKKYQYFFRHFNKAFTQKEFENFPQVTGAQFYLIVSKDHAIVGLVQFSPDWKSNRAFFVGLLIDESYQGNRYPLEAFMCFFDYAFNRLGYRKAIVEILETHESLKRTVVENGFLYEGKLFGECFYNGKYLTELRYCMMDQYYNKTFKPEVDKWGH